MHNGGTMDSDKNYENLLKEINDLENKIKLKDSIIESLNKTLADKDASIRLQEKLIANKDTNIQELKQMLGSASALTNKDSTKNELEKESLEKQLKIYKDELTLKNAQLTEIGRTLGIFSKNTSTKLENIESYLENIQIDDDIIKFLNSINTKLVAIDEKQSRSYKLTDEALDELQRSKVSGRLTMFMVGLFLGATVASVAIIWVVQYMIK